MKNTSCVKAVSKVVGVLVASMLALGLTACGLAGVMRFPAGGESSSPGSSSSSSSSSGASGASGASGSTGASESRVADSTALHDGASEAAGGEPVQEAPARHVDANGDVAYVPAGFEVSQREGEREVASGLVVIAPDGSEYVWVPTGATPLAAREFGSYFSGGSISDYHDEVGLDSYREMAASVEEHGGFYIGRYEASRGADGLPASKRVAAGGPGRIWVQFSPQDTVAACEKLYAGNGTVQGFFPWGANWDTVLQWLVDSGCKTAAEVASDSTGWGNYSDDAFSPSARGDSTGQWEEAKANNIYDLAGNNWEWTRERCGENYVMRGGGYNLMGGACSGSRYPAALRDPLPGNDHHPNVAFRPALYVKGGQPAA